ncbi:MAG TPA: 1-deoxy-D-xylulose-5-phosphate reductoisomerase, partial [Actinomycetota bacterium]|nr:1-deoxy-D-xylulose-5-phosphate reductoisomerase [Actinomycetota bacterium]
AVAAELATLDEADVVLNAIVGCAGLDASVAALRSGKVLALANKESLVAGGRACLDAAAEGGGSLVPVDSEHAALAQCLARADRAEVARIVLTASGGPFRVRRDLSSVTKDEALAHPTWSMGPKITVDSATLMNKGLEVIEAHWLFGFDYDDLGVLVHPQSIVHGMVELRDSTVLLQAAPTDMRIPIQAALLGDERIAGGYERLDLAKVGTLEFEEVDHDRFPAVGLAYRAGRAGGTAPAVLNAANEVAVGAFLEGTLRFTAIAEVVARVLDRHEPGDDSTVEQVVAADRWARQEASETIAGVAA